MYQIGDPSIHCLQKFLKLSGNMILKNDYDGNDNSHKTTFYKKTQEKI